MPLRTTTQLVSAAQLRDSLAGLPSTVAAAVIGASSAKSEGESEGEGEAAKKAKAIEADISSKVVRPRTQLSQAGHVVPRGADRAHGLLLHQVRAIPAPAGVLRPPEARNDAASSSSGDADEALLQGCSSSVTRAIQELPALLSTYFSILPRATSVGGAAKATPQKRRSSATSLPLPGPSSSCACILWLPTSAQGLGAPHQRGVALAHGEGVVCFRAHHVYGHWPQH